MISSVTEEEKEHIREFLQRRGISITDEHKE